MYVNPYLEGRLADQHIKEALRVVKQDCLLREEGSSSRAQKRSFPFGLFLLALVIIIASFQSGIFLVRRH